MNASTHLFYALFCTLSAAVLLWALEPQRPNDSAARWLFWLLGGLLFAANVSLALMHAVFFVALCLR